MKERFLKCKKYSFRIRKGFYRVERYRTQRDREVKIKREIQELFLKPIIVSIDGMDKLDKKEMKKIRPFKNTWFDWFINYIHEAITKSVAGFKDKIVSLFRKNTPKQTVYGRGKKLSNLKRQNIRKPFISKVNKKKNKAKMIRDIWTLFEPEEEKEEKN